MTSASRTSGEIIDKYLNNIKDYFRNPSETDRVFTKGKKVEVVYAIVSKGIPLFRTEGVGDVTVLDINVINKVISIPAILPEKIQAKIRRVMLEKLRGYLKDDIKEVIKKYKEFGFKKGVDGSWNCYIAPPKEAAETDIGMCGYCPACNILGAILTDSENSFVSTSYGLKSRVVHDIAFGTIKYEKSVANFTHNKVGDGVSYTGRSLFEESHILPGVVFVGKLAMYDLTMNEAKLVLSSLSSITRLGGGETKYGSVQVVIIGIKAGLRETISSYDITRYVLEKYYEYEENVAPENVIKTIAEYISNKGFEIIINPNSRLDEMNIEIDLSNDIKSIWEQDNYKYAESVANYIKKVEGKLQSKGSETTKRSRKSTGENIDFE